MNRDIKFRAWNPIAKSMVLAPEQLFVRADGKIGIFYDTHSDIEEVQYPKWEIMQYTGLKDKNGKEIYEGDVVKSVLTNQGHEYPVLMVEWIANVCKFGLRMSRGKKTTKEGESDYSLEQTDRITVGVNQYLEVIGNIYENPELLEKAS